MSDDAQRVVGLHPLGLTLALLAGLSALAPAAGVPSSAAVEFRWDAPADSCPSEAEVLAELERLLGGPVSAQGDRRLAAIARVRREPDGRWDLRLWTVTTDATRQRSMVGDDCSVLAEAAALLAAMAIDPDVLTRASSETAAAQARGAQEVDDPTPPPEPEPDPQPDPEPEPQPDNTSKPAPESLDPPAPADEARLRRRFDIATSLASGISLGDLPGVGPVLRLGLGFVWARARFEIDAHYAFVRKARFDDAPDRGADLRMAMAALRGCARLHPMPATLEIPICGGIELGAQFGVGVGFVTVNEGAVPWIALDLATGLSWTPLEHLAFGLRLEPYLALARPRFEAEGVGEIWRPARVGLRAVAGLEARF